MNRFEVGQIIEAKVIRFVGEQHFVVSIQGNFLQVENQSGERLREGQVVKFIVDSTMPLRLKFLKQTKDGHVHFRI